MLLSIPDLLTPEQIHQCRTALEQALWVDGRSTAGHVAGQVKNNQQLPLEHPAAQQWGQAITAALSSNPIFMAAALPQRILPPRFNRYEGGGEYGFQDRKSVV